MSAVRLSAFHELADVDGDPLRRVFRDRPALDSLTVEFDSTGLIIGQVELRDQNGHVQISRIQLSIDATRFGQKLKNRLISPVDDLAIFADRSGGAWVVVCPRQSVGFFGIHFEFRSYQNQLEVTIDDAFFCGETPRHYLFEVCRIAFDLIRESFRSDIFGGQGLFRQSFHLHKNLLNLLNNILQAPLSLAKDIDVSLEISSFHYIPNVMITTWHVEERASRYRSIDAAIQKIEIDDATKEQLANELRELPLSDAILVRLLGLCDRMESVADLLVKHPGFIERGSLLALSVLVLNREQLKSHFDIAASITKLAKKLIVQLVDSERHQILHIRLPLFLASVWSGIDGEHALNCIMAAAKFGGLSPEMIDAVAAIKVGSLEEARGRMSRLAELPDGNSPGNQRLIAIAVAQLSVDREHVIEKLSPLIATAGSDLPADIRLIRVLVHLGMWDDAIGLGIPVAELVGGDCPLELRELLRKAWIGAKQPGEIEDFLPDLRDNSLSGEERSATQSGPASTEDLDAVLAEYLEDPALIVADPFKLASALSSTSSTPDPDGLHQQLTQLLSLRSPWEQSRIQAMLGLISRDVGHDDAGAIQHFMSAISGGWRDILVERYLRAQLLERRYYEDLLACDLMLLESTQDGYRLEIISEIFLIPSVPLDQTKRASLMTEYIRLGGANQSVFHSHFPQILESGDEASVARILELAMSRMGGSPLIQVLTERTLEHLEKKGNIGELYYRILESQLDDVHDHSEIARRALRTASIKLFPAFYRQFMRILIEHAIEPDADVADVVRIFKSEPKTLVTYLLCRYRRSRDPNLLREALELSQSQSGMREEVLKIYAELGTIQKLSSDQLEVLRESMREDSDWTKYRAVLINQIEATSDTTWKVRLLLEVADIHIDRSNQAREAISCLQQAISYSESRLELRRKLLKIIKSLDDNGSEFVELQNFLRDRQCLVDTAELVEIIFRLTSLYDFRDGVLSILDAQLTQLDADGDFDRCGRVAAALKQSDYVDPRLDRYVLAGILSQGSVAPAIEMIEAMLHTVMSSKDLVDMFHWLSATIRRIDVDSGMDEVCALLSRKLNVSQWPKDIRASLCEQLLDPLIRSDQYSADAINIIQNCDLESLVKLEKLLVPIYVILRDYSQDKLLHSYLRIVLPVLRAKPTLLQSYPFTIESIEAEHSRGLRGLRDKAQVPLPSPSPRPLPSDEQSWRVDVKALRARTDLSLYFDSLIFRDELEKHLAVQALCICAGDFRIANLWHWQVWRHPDHFGYPMDAKDRFPKDLTAGLNLVHGPLHHYLLALIKPMFAYFQERFGFSKVCHDLSIGIDQRNNLLRTVDYEHKLFRDTILVHLIPVLKRRKISMRNAQGLGHKLYYDGESRTVIVDFGYYQSQPITHLYHQVGMLISQVMKQYYIFLQLDPVSEILQFLHKIEERIAPESTVDRAKRFLSATLSAKQSVLDHIDYDGIRAYRRKLANPFDAAQLIDLLQQMRFHASRQVLSETLDLIGMVEAISKSNLLQHPRRATDLVEEHPAIGDLIYFSTTYGKDS